jgi:alpha-L-rhamnosidase
MKYPMFFKHILPAVVLASLLTGCSPKDGGSVSETVKILNAGDWQAQWIADPLAAANEEVGQPRNGYHSNLHKSPDAVVTVTLDLGSVQDFDSVRLYPARPYDWQDTPGFLFPVRYRIDVSDNAAFTNTRLIADRTPADEPNPGDRPLSYDAGHARARYIRLTVTRLALRDEGNYGLALNEIEVLKDGRNIARDAIVIAPEAIVTSAWNPDFLTDGIRKTINPDQALPATYARKVFNITKKIKRATAYISARGLYEFFLNGRKVGDHLLAPEWTAYRTRIQYQAYDVTDLLKKGENVATAALGEGWYAGKLMQFGRFAYGRYPQLITRLEIESTDGSTEAIVTDGSWKTTIDGPVTSSGIYLGETYDARKAFPGWDQPGFDDSGWNTPLAAPLDSVLLVPQRNEPIRIEQERQPVAVSEPVPGTYILDFGQNIVGRCRIDGLGKAGQTVRIRHGEAINPDGTLYTANLRGAKQTDYYTPAVDGPFTWAPQFTYHGFRYAEITGLAEPPTIGNALGQVFHSSAPFTGHFECSDTTLNRLMQNIVWTQRANLMGIPTDCPQRDERFGWMGDIQAFAQTGIFNMDLSSFFRKFLQDTRDDQAADGRFPDFAPNAGDPNRDFSGAPAWADAGVFVPWTDWINYADTQLLRDQFPAAEKYIGYIWRNNPDLIWKVGRHNDYNDWLNGDWIKVEGWPRTGAEVPRELFATAFFARSTRLVAKMARIIGKPDQAAYYDDLADKIKEAFNQAFVAPDGRLTGDTQAGYALALAFDLLPDPLRPKAASYLADNIRKKYHGHLSTGIQTTHRAMLELSKAGYHDLAWQLLQSHSFPSWLYMIDNGATTIWERWDGYVKGRGFQDPGMNSLNHWALGSVGEWMWRNIAGLNPDEEHPGWKHFTLAPVPGGGVTWTDARYESISGTISTRWEIRNGQMELSVTVPQGTTATVILPGAAGKKISMNGKEVKPEGAEGKNARFEVGAGAYRFEYLLKNGT